jgi:hypothetical protein
VVFDICTIGFAVVEGDACRRRSRVGGVSSRVMMPPVEGKVGRLCDPSGKNVACVCIESKRILRRKTTRINMI